jgi:flagellin-like hook-associated protein FlgL
VSGIALSAATRNAALQVQTITSQLGTAESRLESGKAVNSAVDDAVKYFQAKGLDDRAAKFSTIKDSMDQGVSMIATAIAGLTSISSVYTQMKGLAEAAKTADATTLKNISAQWSDLIKQAVSIGTDSTYQGSSLLNADPTTYPNVFDPSTYFSIEKNNGFQPITIPTSADGASLSIMPIAIPTQMIIYNPPPNEIPNSSTVTISSNTRVPLKSGGNYLTDTSGNIVYQAFNLQVAATNPNGTPKLDGNGNQIYNSVPQPVPATDAQGNPILDANGNQEYNPQTGDSFVYQQNTNTYQAQGGTLVYSSSVIYPYMGNAMDVMPEAAGTNPVYNKATDTSSTNSPINISGPTGNGIINNIVTNNDVSYNQATGQAIGTFSGSFSNTTDNTPSSSMPSGTYTFTWTGQWNPGTAAGPSLVAAANLLSGANPDTTVAETWCDNAISYIRSAQSYLGGNITLLRSKIDFVSNYNNTLAAGSGKLTLADLSKEGADLVALQTRQQIGMQAISVSAQDSQNLISLIK